MNKICPTHQKPLRQGTNGSWYCATNMGTKEAPDWCKHKEYDQANQPEQPGIVIQYLEQIHKDVRDLQVQLKELKDGLTAE